MNNERKRKVKEVLAKLAGDDRRCPNCGEPIARHSTNSCVLNAFIGVLRDRGDIEEHRLRELHADCNVDVLWGDVGDVVDKLGSGDYQT